MKITCVKSPKMGAAIAKNEEIISLDVLLKKQQS